MRERNYLPSTKSAIVIHLTKLTVQHTWRYKTNTVSFPSRARCKELREGRAWRGGLQDVRRRDGFRGGQRHVHRAHPDLHGAAVRPETAKPEIAALHRVDPVAGLGHHRGALRHAERRPTRPETLPDHPGVPPKVQDAGE